MSRFKSAQERWDYEKTVGKQRRLARYRQLARLNDDSSIDTIDEQIFNRICVESNCNPHMLRAELLNEDAEYWSKELIDL